MGTISSAMALEVGFVISSPEIKSKKRYERKGVARFVVIALEGVPISEDDRRKKGLQGYYRKVTVRLMTQDDQDDRNGELTTFFTPKIEHFNDEVEVDSINFHEKLERIYT